MSIITTLNERMPTLLNKHSKEYTAIFGDDEATPTSPIADSSDYNTGAVANELEYSKGFCDYITRSLQIDNYYSTYLDKVVYFFTGLLRTYAETDAQLINRFKALMIRNNNKSWSTTWMIRDVFKYFFDQSIIYVIENFIDTDLIIDGSFEENPTVNWTRTASGGSAVDFPTTETFSESTTCRFTIDSSGNSCSLSQVIGAVSTGMYVLGFFTKDDRLLSTNDLFKVTLQRSGDSYYYNFDTQAWQSGEAHWTISKNSGTRYENKRGFVDVPVAMTGQDITLKFENIGGTSDAYKFYLDKIEFGPLLPYPTVKVVLVNIGNQSGFMSAWPGDGDPIADYDYTLASYYGLCYLEGIGGLGTLQYYMDLLNLIKPCGVKAQLEIVSRAT